MNFPKENFCSFAKTFVIKPTDEPQRSMKTCWNQTELIVLQL